MLLYYSNSVLICQSVLVNNRADILAAERSRASAGLLENIRVDYYGTPTPIKQMAVINILDAKTLEIQPWDISSLNDIDRALQKADRGASPVNDGKVIRITLPSMTEDRARAAVSINCNWRAIASL